MRINLADAAKGMAVGLLVGAVLGMVFAPKKKPAGIAARMLKAAGNVVESISDAMGI